MTFGPICSRIFRVLLWGGGPSSSLVPEGAARLTKFDSPMVYGTT